MKGSYPKQVYILITILGFVLLVLNAVLDLTTAASAVGAGLFAYGLNRLVGEWRVNHNPEYAKKLEIANQDERLAFIADKARSMTLIIVILALSILGLVLVSINLKPYGFACFYITCGISVLYFVVYQILSRRY
ncbi:MAG: hypothetical protein IJ860_03540 [Eubacterium sp.]|nr:hypothetical protein [Eubacterium sp.]